MMTYNGVGGGNKKEQNSINNCSTTAITKGYFTWLDFIYAGLNLWNAPHLRLIWLVLLGNRNALSTGKKPREVTQAAFITVNVRLVQIVLSPLLGVLNTAWNWVGRKLGDRTVLPSYSSFVVLKFELYSRSFFFISWSLFNLWHSSFSPYISYPFTLICQYRFEYAFRMTPNRRQ